MSLCPAKQSHVIDTKTNTVIATVNVGGHPGGVAVTPDGSKVYVTKEEYYGTVSVIDTTTNIVTATVNGPGGNWGGVSVTPDGIKVYVENFYMGNTVSVIDTATKTVTSTVKVGTNPIAFGQFIIPSPTKRVLPFANFSSDVTSGYTPLFVQFTDLSKNATSWNWNFGDGANATEQNPIHTYSTAENYTVTLTVSNANGTDTTSHLVNVSNSSNILTTAFSASPTSGKVYLSVSFTDQSIGSPTSWKWTFGDGNTSTVQNPVYTYNKIGQYSVSLTTTNVGGSGSLTKTSYIGVSNSLNAPIAAFSASPTLGKVPLNVIFTDQSTGSITAWKWLFGDGNTSTTQSPAYTYSKAGKYTVTLTIEN
jgi:YVTN family beta-propeller protein